MVLFPSLCGPTPLTTLTALLTLRKTASVSGTGSRYKWFLLGRHSCIGCWKRASSASPADRGFLSSQGWTAMLADVGFLRLLCVKTHLVWLEARGSYCRKSKHARRSERGCPPGSLRVPWTGRSALLSRPQVVRGPQVVRRPGIAMGNTRSCNNALECFSCSDLHQAQNSQIAILS